MLILIICLYTKVFNLKNILSENDSVFIEDLKNYSPIDSVSKKNLFERVIEDSLLRDKIEKKNQLLDEGELKGILKSKNFSIPVEGKISRNQSVGFYGVNIQTDSTEKIRCPMEGVVFDVSQDKITLYHEGGILSKYTNCSDIEVKIGEQVTRGRKIAQVKQDVLHFELWYKGKSIDPKTILKWD